MPRTTEPDAADEQEVMTQVVTTTIKLPSGYITIKWNSQEADALKLTISDDHAVAEVAGLSPHLAILLAQVLTTYARARIDCAAADEKSKS